MNNHKKTTTRPIATILAVLFFGLLALNVLIIVLEAFDIPTKLIYWYEKV